MKKKIERGEIHPFPNWARTPSQMACHEQRPQLAFPNPAIEWIIEMDRN